SISLCLRDLTKNRDLRQAGTDVVVQIRRDSGPDLFKLRQALFPRAAQFFFRDLSFAQRKIDLTEPRESIVKNEGGNAGNRQGEQSKKPCALPYGRNYRKANRCRSLANHPLRIDASN